MRIHQLAPLSCGLLPALVENTETCHYPLFILNYCILETDIYLYEIISKLFQKCFNVQQLISDFSVFHCIRKVWGY